jgi:peptidyl-prolyl cis-trans isomerase D
MKFLRSQSQTVLIIVLGVIGLGMLFYGSSGNLLTSSGGHNASDYGRINGENLSVADLYSAVRNTRYALILGGRGQQLSQPGASEQVAEEAWRQLLLLNEADLLHIGAQYPALAKEVSDKELVDYIKSVPLFQKNGVYDPDVYRDTLMKIQTILRVPADATGDPLAGTAALVETIMGDNLRTNEVSNALFSTVRSSARDVSDQYEKIYAPVTVSVVTIDPKPFIAAAQVSAQDIENEYKNHPENPAYRSKEKRKVDYVLFMLSPDEAKLPDAEKKAAKEALGEKALDFAQAFVPNPTDSGAPPPTPDFITEANKRGLSPATTDFFTADTPPANVPPSPAFNNTAFSLTKDNPISKLVELENGVAVLHLVEIQPSDLLPLDQVKAGIVAQLQQAQGNASKDLVAALDAKQLKDAVAKGTDFKTAAANLKLTVETLPVFVPMKAPQNDQRMQTIAYIASTLSPGQVSEPTPLQSDNSTIIVHLDHRDTADPAGLADFERNFRSSQDEQLRSMVYADWANWASKQPGMRKPADLDLYGTVQ